MQKSSIIKRLQVGSFDLSDPTFSFNETKDKDLLYSLAVDTLKTADI